MNRRRRNEATQVLRIVGVSEQNEKLEKSPYWASRHDVSCAMDHGVCVKYGEV